MSWCLPSNKDISDPSETATEELLKQRLQRWTAEAENPRGSSEARGSTTECASLCQLWPQRPRGLNAQGPDSPRVPAPVL